MAEQRNPFEEFLDRYGVPAGEEGPVLFVREVLGVDPDPWQLRVLRAYGRGERRISIRACHGTGKTAVAAWLIIYQLTTRYPQKTVATAPSAAQLKGALVPEVKMWLRALPAPIQALFDVKAEGIYLRSAPEASYFEARTARAEAPEALQGVHSEHVLLIADEASGVPEQIFEAAAGSMSGHNATTLLLGNPVRTSGFFFDTHHKLRDMWFTVHVTGVPGSPGEYSPRVTPDFVRDIARRYGEDSNAFRVRVLGEFPKADDDSLIPYELLVGARTRDLIPRPDLPVVWGLDVARFGDDANALVIRDSMQVHPHIEEWDGMDLMATAGRVKLRWDETPPHQRPRAILIDAIGLGAGVADRLREQGLPARAVNVSEAASASEKFLNLRAELWWKAREWLESRMTKLPVCAHGCAHDCLHEKLAYELGVPKYRITSSGKIQAEPKAEIKKRGHKSPNIAEAMVLTFAGDAALMVQGQGGNSWAWNEPVRLRRSIV